MASKYPVTLEGAALDRGKDAPDAYPAKRGTPPLGHYNSGKLVGEFTMGHEKKGGRKKGTPNKLPVELKAAILGALTAKGGQAYLERIADSKPELFCSLLGRVLPMTVQGDADQPVKTILEIRWESPQ